jgi:catechol 2,3-dioxygenase-like lactoylglutathione lyase family enzyme
MAVYGIAHVQIPIPSGREDEARSFYGSVLGMLEIPKRESLSDRGGVWFECGGQQLHCGVENAASDTRRHAALLTDDLDKSERNLSGAGSRSPPIARFLGTDVVHARSLRNRIELMQRDRAGR